MQRTIALSSSLERVGVNLTACPGKDTLLALVKRVSGAGFLTGVLLILLTDGRAQEPTPDVGNLSLDSLSSIEITSVSKKEQTLIEAAAAIFVITSEDIRR